MTTRTKSVLLSVSTFFLALMVFVVPAFAQESQRQNQGKPEVVQAILKNTPTRAQIYLTDARLQSCLAREANMQTRSTSLTRMATNMLEKFDSIASRVQDYSERSGKTVARYDALVREMETKRDAVKSAMTASSSNLSGFSCTGNDPKGYITAFLKDMRLVKTTLRDYRTSIKNLIVAVRSVTATEVRNTERSDSTTPKTSNTPNPRSNSQGRGNNQ